MKNGGSALENPTFTDSEWKPVTLATSRVTSLLKKNKAVIVDVQTAAHQDQPEGQSAFAAVLGEAFHIAVPDRQSKS